MMYINVDLLQQYYKFFYKKSALLADKSAPRSGIKNENISDKILEDQTTQLLENLRK